jgi:hypothetical protein
MVCCCVYRADLALSDPTSLLIYSGGQTRPTALSTEAFSYLRLAIASSALPQPFKRATTEDFALDSFQNLMFSVARFHEVRSSSSLLFSDVEIEKLIALSLDVAS